MIKAVIRNIFLAALVVVAVSCVSFNAQTQKDVFQRFEIGNDGQGVVRNFKIVYGEFVIPHGTNFTEIPPVHRTISSESQVVPIPEHTQVSWQSADGKSHEVTMPVRSLIDDMDHFIGFKYFFVDDYLDVYLITRVEHKNSKFLNTIDKKVFTSKP